MRILGLVGATHDSGLAILDNGWPTLVLEEERLNRIKRTKVFPHHSLVAALGADLAGLKDIDVITTPWNVALLRKSFGKAILRGLPGSLSLFLESSHTPQRNEIVLLNSFLRRRLGRLVGGQSLPPIVNVGHHDAHAAVFFMSPFEDATVLVMDGFGDDAATSVYTGDGAGLSRVWWTQIFNSVGIAYTVVTKYLGFAGFSDEGKVMALAAYGDDRYVDAFRKLFRLEPEGRYQLDMSYFDFHRYGELRPLKRKFYETFGPAREPGAPITERHQAIARGLQAVTEEVIVHVARELERRFSSRNLIISGGVALNCVANARVLEQTGFERIWVPPCASDTGAPLGSALWHHHQTHKAPRRLELIHPFYGLGFSDAEISHALAEAGLASEKLDEGELIQKTAQALADGKIVGWFQGRFEMGPRALGNRSILADPRSAGMRNVINAKIKHRENFRPFAPAVLEERAHEFFEITQADPFMTLAPRVHPDRAHEIAAAVHVDGTARIQTVSRQANQRYYDLIRAFGDITGVPIVLNTSFNRHEPIVARPQEAISCYLRTGMDVLVIGDHFVTMRTREAEAQAEARMHGAHNR
ncbi:MAG TPA: carbamoyltransferase C-terminal domain-containing protein [Hyphomicrobiaceae bacterium]|nr:carbamoyltransferase C-terminal domain-containing protein [Hyphomicrobiaceae bacterium]